jgi:hypothetical protein
VWVYRSVDDRVRSSLAKFGDHDRTVVNAIASGAGEGLWQAGGLSAGVRATMADLAGSGLSAESASALFWWARNTMAFDLGLAGRSDVRFQSYDALLRGPEEQMRRLADFLGIAYRPAMVGHIEPRRSAPGRQLPLDSRVRGLCDALQARLDAVGLSAGLSGSAR